jgi:hypothetical protein
MKKRFLSSALTIALLASASSAFAASSIAVNGPGLNGTGNKLQVSFSGAGTNAYVRTDEANGETHYRARFWIDPRNLPITEGNAGVNHIRFIRMNDQGPDTSLGTFIVGFFTKSADDHSYHMIFWVKENDLVFRSRANLFLGSSGTDLPAQVEIEFTQNNSGSESFCARKLAPFTQTICRSNLNLGDGDVDFADIGSFGNSNPASITGNYHFDEFESYR